jgi:hypothetical protein
VIENLALGHLLFFNVEKEKLLDNSRNEEKAQSKNVS